MRLSHVVTPPTGGVVGPPHARHHREPSATLRSVTASSLLPPNLFYASVGGLKPSTDRRSPFSSGERKANSVDRRILTSIRTSTGAVSSSISGRFSTAGPEAMLSKVPLSRWVTTTVCGPSGRPHGTTWRSAVQSPSSWNERRKSPDRCVGERSIGYAFPAA